MNDKMNNTEKQALVDWNSVSLGKLTLSSDYGTSKKTNDNTGIPVLRMGNMKDGKIVLDNLVFLELENSEFQRLKLYPGDILINRTNSADLVGKVSIFDLDGDYVCASYIVRFKINQEIINPYYLNYYMNMSDSQNRIKTIATQAIQQANINPTTLKKSFIVKFPKSKHEQDKIVNIIKTWDKAIELKEKLIEEKKKQKNGLMQKLLTGKVRLPGFDGGWKEVKLGSILKERNETNYGDLELLAITSKNGVVRRSEIDSKDNSSEDKSRYKRICPLDIGYNTMRMWQGVSGVSKYEGIVSPAYTILKPTEKVNSYYIGYLFKLPRIINLFWRNSQGLTNDTLNLKYTNFKKIKVTIPTDIKEQDEIVNVLQAIDKSIEISQKEIEQLQLQKKGLMQLLLTGIVRMNIQKN